MRPTGRAAALDDHARSRAPGGDAVRRPGAAAAERTISAGLVRRWAAAFLSFNAMHTASVRNLRA